MNITRKRRLQGGWSATEMVIASSLVAMVAVSAGTFSTMFARRLATTTAKSAATEQANRFADLLARYAGRSISYWGTTSYLNESNVILFCTPDSEPSAMSNTEDGTLQMDPNGNTWKWGGGRYMFYWSDASGGWDNGSNAMPMLGSVTSWTPYIISPVKQNMVDANGNSLYPCITAFTMSPNFQSGVVTITVTAIAREVTGGTSRATGAGRNETITVTRQVHRPR